MGFVAIEAWGKKAFEQFPFIKHNAKRLYHLMSYALSSEKFKYEGNVIQVTPNDGFEYYYGYYDKSPWDAIGRYMIAIKVKQAYKNVAPKEEGEVVLVDTQNGNHIVKIGITHSWNVQQGCMAQWLGPDYSSRIIYNSAFRIFRQGIGGNISEIVLLGGCGGCSLFSHGGRRDDRFDGPAACFLLKCPGA